MPTISLSVIQQRFSTADLSGIDVRNCTYFFQTPHFQACYGRIYRIASGLGFVAGQSGLGFLADEEFAHLNTWDFQMRGGAIVHGDGVVSEGNWSQSIIDDRTLVQVSDIEAVLDNVFIKNDLGVPVGWSGVEINQDVDLYLSLVESDRSRNPIQSSRLYNDLEAVISSGLLVATRASGINSPIDFEPAGKVFLQLQRHIDRRNPHSDVMFQDSIQASGLTVFSGIEVFGDVTVSGLDFGESATMTFPGTLAFSRGIFHNDLVFVDDSEFFSGLEVRGQASGLEVIHNTVEITDPANLLSGTGVINSSGIEIAAVSVPNEAETIIFGDILSSGNIIFQAHLPKTFPGQEFLSANVDDTNIIEHHNLLHCHMSGLQCQPIDPDDPKTTVGTVVYTAKGPFLVDGSSTGTQLSREDFLKTNFGVGSGRFGPDGSVTLLPGGFASKNTLFFLNVFDEFEFNRVSVFIKLRHPDLREYGKNFANPPLGTNVNLGILLTPTLDNLRDNPNDRDDFIVKFARPIDLIRGTAPELESLLDTLATNDGGLFGIFAGGNGLGNQFIPDSQVPGPTRTAALPASGTTKDLSSLSSDVPGPVREAMNSFSSDRLILDTLIETGKKSIISRRTWVLRFQEITKFLGAASPVLEEWGLIFEVTQLASNPDLTTPSAISGIHLHGIEDPILRGTDPDPDLFRLQGNLELASGVLIDGLRPSDLRPLIDGSNADALHKHLLLSDHMYVFSAPTQKNTIFSGASFGLLDSTRFAGRNWLDWYAPSTDQTVVVSTQLTVPEGAFALRSLKVLARGDIATSQDRKTGIMVHLNDTDKNQTVTQRGEFFPSEHGETILFSGLKVIDGTWTPGEQFEVITYLRSSSGLGIHLGGIVADFTPGVDGSAARV